MSFDFPANPTQGQEYTAIVNGLTYVYLNTQWVIKDADAPNDGNTYGRKNKLWQQVAANSFPDAPNDGQTYGRKGDVAWVALAAPVPVAYIGDAAPSSPVQGHLWWNSTNGNLYIYYNDGTSSQWVQINTVGS